MNAENLRKLLQIGERFLEKNGGWRRIEEAMSAWGLRLARRTWWPHLDAETYFTTFGRKELLWCLMTADKKKKLPVRADFASEFKVGIDGEIYDAFDPVDETEVDGEVNDFVRWRKELPELLSHCTENERECIGKFAEGKTLNPRESMAKLRGIRRMKERMRR